METDDVRLLFDYGIAPDKPPLYPIEAPAVDQVVLTHAHLDHSGMIPWLASRFESTIMTTPVTSDVSTLMHHDSLKIARSEGFPEPFNNNDIESTQKMYDHMDFEHPRKVGPLGIKFHSAGHIPGAAQVEVNSSSGTMVFTGDLFTRPQRLVGAGNPVKCDVLCMETTYAGREHTPRDQTERDFLDFVDDVTKRGGQVLAPCFAVGRAQELAMVLMDKGYNVWMDGMARTVATIFSQHPQFLRDPAEYERAMSQVKMIRNHRGRGVALNEADVILTTSGMMQGGPILFYLDRLRNDAKNGVAITGYQVKGTNGRRLIDEGVIDFDTRDPGKKVYKVECEVKKFDFSAHAGHSDLVKFAKATGAEDIVLFHGDHREELVPDLSDFATVHTPMMGDPFSLR
jgi:putative mRNA 3-end processing factor